MLRKNNLPKKQSPDRYSVSCQTEQFLLYLAMQQKLEHVYREYRQLQAKSEQASRLIQHLTYKNKYLETSLCEISIAFQLSTAKNNIHHIQEIKNLEQIITRESQELADIHGDHANACFSNIQEGKNPERKIARSKNSPANSLNQKDIDCSPSMIRYRKISAVQQSHLLEDKPQSSLSESQNQFLPVLPQSTVLAEKPRTVNCESQRYEGHRKAQQDQKYATSRHNGELKQKKSTSKKNHQQSGKQNINYEKLIRIQAELKMKEFMEKFQMDSRLREPFNSNIYCQQQEFNDFQEEPQDFGCKTMR